MKRIIITSFALIMSIALFSQEQELSKKEQKQLQKKLKKEQQAEELAQKAALTAVMVEHRTFVLEAEQLRDKQGATVTVASMLNFIAADSIMGVIQIGSYQYVGDNGVGGITVEGPISNYEYTFNEKNGIHSISYNISSAVGHYNVRMTAFPDGRADATISSNWPGRVNYIGYLVPPGVSTVFKGTSRY